MHKQSNGFIWKLALPFGVGTGILWIAISLKLYSDAALGLSNGRTDWFVGWTLVATLLMGAGIAAVAGTLWHRRIVRNHRW